MLLRKLGAHPGEFPCGVGGTQKAAACRPHPPLPPASPLQEFSSATFCHSPGFCPGSPPSPLSKPPFPVQGADSLEGKQGWKNRSREERQAAEERAASPPECGSHSQRTADRPVQNGCGDSWRAWRSTHAILARQLSHALHSLAPLGSPACWPYPHPEATSCTKSNLLVLSC